MVITSSGEIIGEKPFTKLNASTNKYYYHGFLYVNGKRAGQESASYIAERCNAENIFPFREMYGAFSCVVKCNDGSIKLFSDNSSLHCFYKTDYAVSNSLLELIDYIKENKKTLTYNKRAVCEVLTLGKAFCGETVFEEITITSRSDLVVIKGGQISVESKGIGDVDGESNIKSYDEYFGNLAYAVGDGKLCQGLTGGYDSRMIFACLNDKTAVTPFISGDNDEDADIKTAAKVAAACNTMLDIIKTEKPKISEEFLKELFEFYDGAVPFANDGAYRGVDFRKNRAQKGFEIYFTGDGGVLHKDWDWMQDLPFYHKKNVDINRFYRQRIGFLCDSKIVGNSIKSEFDSQQKYIVDKLKPYVKRINTESYDSLYFNVTGNRAPYYNACTEGVLNYAPLSEFELVKLSYHLPRRTRFYYNNIRNVTTAASKEIARIPTNYGTTASSESLYKFKDVFVQLKDYFKKACRLIGRKLFHKSLFCGNVLTWTMADDLKKLDVTKKALEFAKSNGWVNNEVTVENLTATRLSSVLYLYYASKAAFPNNNM